MISQPSPAVNLGDKDVQVTSCIDIFWEFGIIRFEEKDSNGLNEISLMFSNVESARKFRDEVDRVIDLMEKYFPFDHSQNSQALIDSSGGYSFIKDTVL